ncbi:MAG: hypothetical protein HQ517_14665 [SAR324 cluster bacterium]|nr:hypothetical protein [SAR324 cluster bacterium]
MHDEIQEKYVFYRMVHADFEECSSTLGLLSEIENKKIKLALVKAAIVAYYRPFSGSNPVNRSRKWKLDEALITDIQTHEEVKKNRMHLVAHSDLEFREPQLAKIGELFPISFKGFYFENFMELVEPLRKLASDMVTVMSKEILKYEKDKF